jgi:hypothetical protein
MLFGLFVTLFVILVFMLFLVGPVYTGWVIQRSVEVEDFFCWHYGTVFLLFFDLDHYPGTGSD